MVGEEGKDIRVATMVCRQRRRIVVRLVGGKRGEAIVGGACWSRPKAILPFWDVSNGGGRRGGGCLGRGVGSCFRRRGVAGR